MDSRFAQMVETLHPSFERLVAMPAIGQGRFPRPMPMSGVYLFSEAIGTSTWAVPTIFGDGTSTTATRVRTQSSQLRVQASP